MTHELETLFPDVPSAAVARARHLFRALEVTRGFTLFEEGEEDSALLLVVSGRVAVRTADLELAAVGSGAVLGEIAMFGTPLRVASGHAVTDTVVLTMEREAYQDLVADHADLAASLERRALSQLAARNRAVAVRVAALAAPRMPSLDETWEDDTTTRSADPTVDVLLALRRSRPFSGAPTSVLEQLLDCVRPLTYADGEALCQQAAAAGALHVVLSGEVEVKLRDEASAAEEVLAVAEGGVVGGVSAIDGLPRMATCLAAGTVRTLCIDRAASQALVHASSQPGHTYRVALARSLGELLASTNARFAQLTLTRQRRTQQRLRGDAQS